MSDPSGTNLPPEISPVHNIYSFPAQRISLAEYEKQAKQHTTRHVKALQNSQAYKDYVAANDTDFSGRSHPTGGASSSSTTGRKDSKASRKSTRNKNSGNSRFFTKLTKHEQEDGGNTVENFVGARLAKLFFDDSSNNANSDISDKKSKETASQENHLTDLSDRNNSESEDLSNTNNNNSHLNNSFRFPLAIRKFFSEPDDNDDSSPRSRNSSPLNRGASTNNIEESAAASGSEFWGGILERLQQDNNVASGNNGVVTASQSQVPSSQQSVGPSFNLGNSEVDATANNPIYIDSAAVLNEERELRGNSTFVRRRNPSRDSSRTGSLSRGAANTTSNNNANSIANSNGNNNFITSPGLFSQNIGSSQNNSPPRSGNNTPNNSQSHSPPNSPGRNSDTVEAAFSWGVFFRPEELVPIIYQDCLVVARTYRNMRTGENTNSPRRVIFPGNTNNSGNTSQDYGVIPPRAMSRAEALRLAHNNAALGRSPGGGSTTNSSSSASGSNNAAAMDVDSGGRSGNNNATAAGRSNNNLTPSHGTGANLISENDRVFSLGENPNSDMFLDENNSNDSILVRFILFFLNPIFRLRFVDSLEIIGGTNPNNGTNRNSDNNNNGDVDMDDENLDDEQDTGIFAGYPVLNFLLTIFLFPFKLALSIIVNVLFFYSSTQRVLQRKFLHAVTLLSLRTSLLLILITIKYSILFGQVMWMMLQHVPFVSIGVFVFRKTVRCVQYVVTFEWIFGPYRNNSNSSYYSPQYGYSRNNNDFETPIGHRNLPNDDDDQFSNYSNYSNQQQQNNNANETGSGGSRRGLRGRSNKLKNAKYQFQF